MMGRAGRRAQWAGRHVGRAGLARPGSLQPYPPRASLPRSSSGETNNNGAPSRAAAVPPRPPPADAPASSLPVSFRVPLRRRAFPVLQEAVHLRPDRPHGRGRRRRGLRRRRPPRGARARRRRRLRHIPPQRAQRGDAVLAHAQHALRGGVRPRQVRRGRLGSPASSPEQGLVLDAGIEEELRLRHLQVADAARASLGLPVVEYVVTDAPLEIKTWFDPNCGKSTGSVGNSDSLLRAVGALVKHSDVNAVAVVARFPDDDPDDLDCYREGKGVDLLAGVEAIISHLIVKEFKIPAAHAPAVVPPPLSPSLSPRSAAEEVGYTFLPCVLAGLSSAPQYVTRRQGTLDNGCIVASDIDSVIIPKDACGGDATLAFARTARKNKPLIITVQENETVLDDTPDKFCIEALNVQNYWEAIGVVAAHKAGLNPNALRRHGIDHLKRHERLYSARSSGPRSYASSPIQDKVYVHQLA